MKNKISTSLLLFAAFLFSPNTSGLFTQAKAQCQPDWYVGSFSDCTVDFADDDSLLLTVAYYYYWTFGDAQTSTLKEPSHTYSASGTYNVCLTLSIPAMNCSDSLCKNVTVNCIANGIASSEQIDVSLSVNNPIFSSADIHYSIPTSGSMELILFDLVGNRIDVLETGTKSAGMHSYKLNTGSFSKGIYFIQLGFEGANITKKIIISE